MPAVTWRSGASLYNQLIDRGEYAHVFQDTNLMELEALRHLAIRVSA